MATRSALLRLHSNGNIRGIYCHYDGNPEHQMPILEAQYNSALKVDRLIGLGDLSALQASRDWQGNECPQGPLTYRSRGEEWPMVRPRRFTDLQDARQYFQGMDCEYLYQYLPYVGWKCVMIR